MLLPFSAIYWGIYFLFCAVCQFADLRILVGAAAMLEGDRRKRYRRYMGICYVALCVIFVVCGYFEKNGSMSVARILIMYSIPCALAILSILLLQLRFRIGFFKRK